jgi:predicted nucleotidyltransferase
MSSKIKRSLRENRGVGLSSDDREIFLKLKNEIGVPYVVAWGSRVLGYWAEDSDYDVRIPKFLNDEMRKKITSLEHLLGVKFDISIGNGHDLHSGTPMHGEIIK